MFIDNCNNVEKKYTFGFQFVFMPLIKEKKSQVDLEIYRGGDTTIKDLISIFNLNPLPDLKIQPTNNENAICYKKIYTFNTDDEAESVYPIIKSISEKLLKFIDM